jgi:hypothetical protein
MKYMKSRDLFFFTIDYVFRSHQFKIMPQTIIHLAELLGHEINPSKA